MHIGKADLVNALSERVQELKLEIPSEDFEFEEVLEVIEHLEYALSVIAEQYSD